jgi:hypothetical protein
MIKVNNITPPTAEAFSPDDTSLGFLNEYVKINWLNYLS